MICTDTGLYVNVLLTTKKKKKKKNIFTRTRYKEVVKNLHFGDNTKTK